MTDHATRRPTAQGQNSDKATNTPARLSLVATWQAAVRCPTDRGRRHLVDEPVQRRVGSALAEPEAIAFDLCVLIFRRGKTDGRYAIAMEELPEAMGVNPVNLQKALELAMERAWLEYAGLLLALK